MFLALIEWKDIKDYEGLYQISSNGQVRNSRTGKVLKLYKDKNGYNFCTLSNITQKHIKVHRLVYQAFIGELDKSLVIDHIDTIRTNNVPSNLRQIPSRENTSIAKRNKTGYRGVRYFPLNKQWGAEIQIKGKVKFLGLFDTPELASIQYQQTLQAL
jgi:hypothetical protein